MAIVSLYSKGRAASVKEAVKMGLTRRFLNRVGLGEDGDEEGGGKKDRDLEKAWGELREGKIGDTAENSGKEKEKEKVRRFTASIEGREQAMPADAVLASEDADDVCWLFAFLFRAMWNEGCLVPPRSRYRC